VNYAKREVLLERIEIAIRMRKPLVLSRGHCQINTAGGEHSKLWWFASTTTLIRATIDEVLSIAKPTPSFNAGEPRAPRWLTL
jgi:hypothetical protein